MIDWGALATVAGIISAVNGFLLKLIWSSLSKQIDENKRDRMEAFASVWHKHDKMQESLTNDYVHRRELEQIKADIIYHMDIKIGSLVKLLKAENSKNG